MIFALLAIAPLHGVAAANPGDGWQDEDKRSFMAAQRSFATTIGSPVSGPRLVIECRSPEYILPELVVTLQRMGGSSAKEGTLTLRHGGEVIELSVSQLASDDTGPNWRWTSAHGKDIERVARFASNPDIRAPFSVTAPDGSSHVFALEGNGPWAFGTVTGRCLPSAARVRARIGGMRSPDPLNALWADAFERCQAGSDEEALTGCAERLECSERLRALGQCYGRQNEFGYQMRWHRCGSGSNR